VKTIYVDLDDVLCETARQCLFLVEREFGKLVKFDQLSTFDLGVSCSLTPSEREHLYRIMHVPEEILAVAPIPEAIDTLRGWVEAGSEIAIVTGRPPETHEASRHWLEQHNVPHVSLTFVDKYGRFETRGSHAIDLEELQSRRYAWAVEDSLPMAHFLAEKMGLEVLLVDRPWNQAARLPHNVSRHRDWKTIARRPRSISEVPGSREAAS
jgi:uncharacterized HAD superfamily protein